MNCRLEAIILALSQLALKEKERIALRKYAAGQQHRICSIKHLRCTAFCSNCIGQQWKEKKNNKKNVLKNQPTKQ